MMSYKFIFAGIGSQKTPKEVQKQETDIATILEAKGGKLRSGGADGSDEAFELGIKNEDNKEIFTANNKNIPKIAFDIARQFHPAWYKLTLYGKTLMARNSQIILGQDCNKKVNFVVCWTPMGKVVGGTGQGLRIAKYYNIPVYNLFFVTHLHKLLNLIETFKWW